MLLEPSRSEYLRLTRAWVSGAFAAGPWAADAADITDQDAKAAVQQHRVPKEIRQRLKAKDISCSDYM